MNVEMNLKMKNKIIVYTLPNCGYCKTVKDFLNTSNVAFEERSTANFKDEWDKIGFTVGMSSTPTVVVGDNIYVPARDYSSPDHLLMLINNKISVDNDKLTIERLKTLTYHTYSAFGKLDGLLRQIENKLNEE